MRRRLIPLAGALVALVAMIWLAAGVVAQTTQSGQTTQAGQPAQPARPQAPAGPTPRWPDGHVNLGPVKGEKGLWLPVDARLSLAESGPGRGPGGPANAPRYKNPKYSAVPFQPWARALFEWRLLNPVEPHSRCKPSGGPRQIMTPYGIEFVDIPELKRIFIMDIGGPYSSRTIYMDGRAHPKTLMPSYYGHSVGQWEGDTLVVDTVGFNEAFWLDREGNPHTEQLHLIEKFTRPDMNSLLYVVTVDDPGAYTAPWTGGFYMRWSPGPELFEYICQENNFASELLVGAGTSIDRRSQIVP